MKAKMTIFAKWSTPPHFAKMIIFEKWKKNEN